MAGSFCYKSNRIVPETKTVQLNVVSHLVYSRSTNNAFLFLLNYRSNNCGLKNHSTDSFIQQDIYL